MLMSRKTIGAVRSIEEAVCYFNEAVARYPERDLLSAQRNVMAGRPRPYPVLQINHLIDPEDTFEPEDEFLLPSVETAGTPEGSLVREIINMLAPLKLLNPVKACFGLGAGPGTLVTCFDIPLNPNARNAPAHNKSLDQLLRDPFPDPEISGLMPEMRNRIDNIKKKVPDHFNIHLPDIQGPFNLAHLILGTEVFTSPYTDPGKFHTAMQKITDFWIQARKILIDWIGPERISPWYWSDNIVCECSVNMISPAMYREFVLPYDRQIAEAIGSIAIHPCSGSHVFHVTLNSLPNVVYTEAGYIENIAAGAISVDEASEAIGDRPIALGIGQELPPGREYEFIKKDLERYLENPRLIFEYTGMHWRKKDRPLIRDIHKRLDNYWEKAIRTCF